MDHKQHSHYFLIIALIIAVGVVYFIAKPFLEPLILAAVFAFLFQPIYKSLFKLFKNRETLAALLTTLIAIVLVLLPLTFLGTQIFKESSQLYQSLVRDGSGVAGSLQNFLNQTRDIFPVPADFRIDFSEYVKQGLEFLIKNIGTVFSSFAKILLNTFVFLMAFFFLLKDGGKLKDYFVALSPLDNKDDELVVLRVKRAVSATVKGNLSIGVIQGILTGIGFAIFGVSNPVLWGGVAAITALIPGVGTALVIVPGIIFLFLTGNFFRGIGLLFWGMIAVGLIDNFLGPKLVGRGMQLHPLAVFISVLGGIAFFGPLGFLFGPLVISICLVLIEVYSSLKAKED